MVDTFNAYPHLLLAGLKHRFPFAVVNVIVTAICGENSDSGAKRFSEQVLCHRPDVIILDYGLNDRDIGLAKSRESWAEMVEKALANDIKVILLTPTGDISLSPSWLGENKGLLEEHAVQIRDCASVFGVGLVDSLAAFQKYMEHGKIEDLLSWGNHPNRKGHELVTEELLRWFPIT
jgi:lysophospholipase L1-like esterase